MSSSPDERRDDRALRAVWRELRKPRILLSYLRKSGDLTVPLIFAGPTFVVLAYVVAFGLTPDDRATTDFHAAASQIIPVLVLVLAVEGFAAGEGPISDAVEAVLDAAVTTARNVADALLRQATALLLLASLLVGEVVALVPLLTDDPASANAKPVMAAIVAGFAGVAYVAVTGSRFLARAD